MRLGERAAEDGEVLAEDEDEPAAHRTPAGHHPVARNLLRLHAEVAAAVLDEHIPLLEGAGIEQHLDTLARAELALVVLGLDTALAAAGPGRRPLALEPSQNLLHGTSPLRRPDRARPALVAEELQIA